MKRHAFLIHLWNEPLRDSPQAGLAVLASYLRSDLGGAWQASEIQVLDQLSRDDIIQTIHSAAESDYALVYVVGPGKLERIRRPWPELHVLIPQGGILTEQDLNPGADRCIIVVDSSRAGAKRSVPTSTNSLTVTSKATSAQKKFEERVRLAEAGLVRVFAREQLQSKTPTVPFTESLLQIIASWAEMQNDVLTVNQAVELAKAAMGLRADIDAVIYEGGRRLRHFPIAVKG